MQRIQISKFQNYYDYLKYKTRKTNVLYNFPIWGHSSLNISNTDTEQQKCNAHTDTESSLYNLLLANFDFVNRITTNLPDSNSGRHARAMSHRNTKEENYKINLWSTEGLLLENLLTHYWPLCNRCLKLVQKYAATVLRYEMNHIIYLSK